MIMKLKILLVEDNQSDVELIKYELKKSGLDFVLTVVQTRVGFEQALMQVHPDIILSDYSLPSFDGLSAFRTKQELFPDIPFIMVSGIIGEENAVELIKIGVTDYTLKDKLFTLVPKIERGLREASDLRGKRIAHDQLKTQNQNLTEIAFLQSHQVRAPIARILGLFNLFNFHDLGDKINVEVLCNLKLAAESFDKIIHDIVDKTNQIKADDLGNSDDNDDQPEIRLAKRCSRQLNTAEQ
jgi:CheY-like chemotaxis protein